jgi:hypothetical protein
MSRSVGSLSVVVTLMVVAGAAFSLGCSGSNTTALAACSGDCNCSGATCTCKTGGTCTFGPSAGGGGLADAGEPLPNDVNYSCSSKNTCNSICGTGCTTACSGKSTCEGSCLSNCTTRCDGTSLCTVSTGI